MNPRHRSNSQRGFTLVELIAVMVIVVIIGVTAATAFFDTRKSAESAVASAVFAGFRTGID